MKSYLFIFLLCMCSYNVSAQYPSYISYNDVLACKDLKKAYDLLNGKFWVLSKECENDTCTTFATNKTYPDYNYASSWTGRKNKDSIFLEFQFDVLKYLKDPDQPGGSLYVTPTCQPDIMIKGVKSYEPLTYTVIYGRGYLCEMELVFKDKKTFIFRQTTCEDDNKKRELEFVLRMPSEQEKKHMQLKK